MELKEAKEELKEVNNQLTLYMKKKKALQVFIEEEENRLEGIETVRSKAFDLRNDEMFFKEHGRRRTAKEISLLMNYSERQVRRFLKED